MASAQVKTAKATAYPFNFAMHDLGKLTSHPIVQRRVKQAKVRKIAGKFDQNLLGTLSVNQHGRHFHVFDGQHRMLGMRLYLGAGSEVIPVPCHVYKDLDDETCARIANGLNAHTAWSPLDTFKSEVIAKEPATCAINAIVEGYGLRVESHAGATHVRAVSALRTIAEYKNGLEILTMTFGFLLAAWPGNADAIGGDMLDGMGLLVQRHGTTIDGESLVRRMRKTTPLELGAQAKLYIGFNKGSKANAVYAVLVRLYDTGRRSGKINP